MTSKQNRLLAFDRSFVCHQYLLAFNIGCNLLSEISHYIYTKLLGANIFKFIFTESEKKNRCKNAEEARNFSFHPHFWFERWLQLKIKMMTNIYSVYVFFFILGTCEEKSWRLICNEFAIRKRLLKWCLPADLSRVSFGTFLINIYIFKLISFVFQFPNGPWLQTFFFLFGSSVSIIKATFLFPVFVEYFHGNLFRQSFFLSIFVNGFLLQSKFTNYWWFDVIWNDFWHREI